MSKQLPSVPEGFSCSWKETPFFGGVRDLFSFQGDMFLNFQMGALFTMGKNFHSLLCDPFVHVKEATHLFITSNCLCSLEGGVCAPSDKAPSFISKVPQQEEPWFVRSMAFHKEGTFDTPLFIGRTRCGECGYMESWFFPQNAKVLLFGRIGMPSIRGTHICAFREGTLGHPEQALLFIMAWHPEMV